MLNSEKTHIGRNQTKPSLNLIIVVCVVEIDMYFQLDFPTTATTTDYAKVKVGKDLSTATVCFWMKTDDQENQGTPFSYATSDGDNVFTLSDYDRWVLVYLG